MEKLLEILTNCCQTIDFKNEKELVTGKKIDSMDLVAIISDIEDEYNIDIEMSDIEPSNFDSIDAIYELIQRLQNDK